jgi:hypothetical protein
MFSKHSLGAAAAILLSGGFFCSTAQALNVASLLSDVAADITIVKATGRCGANPFFNDPPCHPVRATCPVGKIPVPIKATECTTLAKNVDFDVNHSKAFSTATVVATGYVECNPMSRWYWDPQTGQNYEPRMGYSPLCSVQTKNCNALSYTVTARCITSPKKDVIDKLGIK